MGPFKSSLGKTLSELEEALSTTVTFTETKLLPDLPKSQQHEFAQGVGKRQKALTALSAKGKIMLVRVEESQSGIMWKNEGDKLRLCVDKLSVLNQVNNLLKTCSPSQDEWAAARKEAAALDIVFPRASRSTT